MLELIVNGQILKVTSPPDTPLLWVLRGELKLTETKFGCGAALCGACTVHVDNKAVRSCILPVAAASGKRVTTIRGLLPDVGKAGPEAEALIAAWDAVDVVQCGYCQPGQIMSACALLFQMRALGRKPSEGEIAEWMSGNLCRCGTYPRIRKAIEQAAATLFLPGRPKS